MSQDNENSQDAKKQIRQHRQAKNHQSTHCEILLSLPSQHAGDYQNRESDKRAKSDYLAKNVLHFSILRLSKNYSVF
ncbi:MAG: hypothetical protein AAB358_01480 [Patescibacteria group bacterium]